MDPEHVVFDISSDEESLGFREGRDLEWIADFLGVGDDDDFGKLTDGESDDVVVLREVNTTGKSKSLRPPVKDDEDDDDCVILDCDPDKPAIGADSTLNGDSDELLIVGEKGQIACRDFPHSRHLCASLPFQTTQHEKHCSLCHCYVCDSPAPCPYWAAFNSSGDHCHATDKSETWKSRRRDWKLRKKLPLQPQNVAKPSPPWGVHISQPLDIIRLSAKPRPQGCSSTNLSPGILSRTRTPQSVLGLPKNNFQRLLGSGHNIQRGKIGNSGHFTARQSPSTFKRTGSVGVSLPVGVSQIQPRHHSGQHVRAFAGWPGNRQSSSQPNLRSEASSIPPSQHQLYSQSAPPPTEGHNCQSSSQPNLRTEASSTPHSQQQFYRQSVPPPTEGHTLHQFPSSDQGIHNFQNKIQSSNAKVPPSSIDYDPNWAMNACQSNPIPAEIPQAQGTRLPVEPPSAESIFDFSTIEPNIFSGYADNEWSLEDLSTPEVPEGSYAPLESDNIYSPEPSSVDAGLLAFDFEASPRF